MTSWIALLLVLLPGLAAPDDSKVKYSTPVVRLYTDLGWDEAYEVIDDITFFEDYIDGFFRAFDLTPKKSNPIRCHLYKDPQEFVDVRSREHAIGSSDFAFFSINNNRIVASYTTFGDVLEETGAARAALRRVCARPIVQRYFSNTPPAWFDEGLSCYFEGIAFDTHHKLISTCNEFSRFESMRTIAKRAPEVDWERLFDERPVDYQDRRDGANRIGGWNSSIYWGVFFFYLNAADEETQAFFRRFIQGMNTGRERSKLLMEDLKNREEAFFDFFLLDHQATLHLYREAEKLGGQGKYTDARLCLLKILEQNDGHEAALRLAADFSWDEGRYEPSLIFWRRLSALDPKNDLYLWKICRCLVESGRRNRNGDTLDEAIRVGTEAVRLSRSQDPDCHAALAMAYHASGNYSEALESMRRATFLGGPGLEGYKEKEREYSRDLIEYNRTKER